MFRPGRVALLCALAALAAAAVLPAPAGAQARRSVVIAFYTAYPTETLSFEGEEKPYEPQDTVLRRWGDQPGLKLGLLSTIQGEYTQPQALLDITQGTRQSTALYTPRKLLNLDFDRATASFPDWPFVRRRGDRVSVTIKPGLLASSIPGGAAYVGVAGRNPLAAIAAADERGRVAALSLGPMGTLAARAQAEAARKRLVVVGVPPGVEGLRQIDALLANRAPGQMLMLSHLPATPPDRAIVRPPPRFFKQPAFALADGGPGGSVTSGTTRQDGLVSAIDVLPTVLEWLRIDAPNKARGENITAGKRISARRLQELRRRWADVRGARQSSSFRAVGALAGVILLLLGALRGIRLALPVALRLGALGLMWWPTTVLLAAAVEPQARLLEIALIATTAMLLAVLTDRFLPWPRGPLVPVAVGIAAYTVDLAFNGELLTRSVLGPSVAFGARFYGVSNELEPLLPILLLAGLAAYQTGRPITRRTVVLYAVAGLVLGLIVGWGRLGADVGGVITVGMGMAVATLVLLPGGITKRALAVTALVPVAAIAVLVLVDLVAAGGSHLSRNLLRTDNARELWELVERRYELAWRVLRTGRTPAYFLGAALAVWFAVRNRSWLYPELPRPWTAALIGGLAAGVAGTLTNDSGPVLLVNSVLALGGMTAYIIGGTLPARWRAGPDEPPEREPAAGTPRPDPVLTS
jgi:hypothetical protein